MTFARRPTPSRGGLRSALWVAATLVAGLVGHAAAQDDAAAGEPRAGLVVAMPDGQVRAMCVVLGAPEISGDDLLRRAGVDVSARVTPLGTMICGLDGQGCDHPREPCWCACRSLGGDCRYWAYHVREDGAWRYAPLGPGARRVRHGDVDGWAWGAGSLVAGATPPDLGWAAICGDDGSGRVAAATSEPTAGATAPRSTAAPGERRVTEAARPGGTPTASRGTRQPVAREGPRRGSRATEEPRGNGGSSTPSATVVRATGSASAADGAGGSASEGEPGGVAGRVGLGDAGTATASDPVGVGERSDPGARARPATATREARSGEGGGAAGSRRGDYLFFLAVVTVLVAGVWWLRRAA